MVHSKEYDYIERRLFVHSICKFLKNIEISRLVTSTGWVEDVYDYRIPGKIISVDFDMRFIDFNMWDYKLRYFFSKNHNTPTNEEKEKLCHDIIQSRIYCGYCGKRISNENSCRGESGYSRNSFHTDLKYHDKNTFQYQKRKLRHLMNKSEFNEGERKSGLNLFKRMNPPKLIPNSVLQVELVYHIGHNVDIQIQSFGLDWVFEYNIPLFRRMKELYNIKYLLDVLPESYIPEYYDLILKTRESLEQIYTDSLCDITNDESDRDLDDSDFENSEEEEDDPDYEEIEPPPKRRKPVKKKKENL